MNISDLLGKTEQEAVDEIKKAKMKPRIVHKDGKDFMGTCDFRTDRVNLAINEGKVIRADIG